MQFKYKAVKEGKVVNANLNAESQDAVLRFLKTNNYFPVSIHRSDSVGAGFLDFLFNRVSFTDVVDITRQLAIMLNAGLTLIDSIDILKKQVTKSSVLSVLDSIDKEIRGGSTFSKALALYPQYFSGLYISLVKSGEASGKLAEILLKLSDNLEKERTFRAKLRGALIYPAIIIVAMFAVGFIMMTFVIPKLLELYKNFGAKLPVSTQILIFVSSFFQNFWYLILIFVFGGVFLVSRYLKTPSGKYLKDSLALRLPILKNVIKMAALVDATRTFSILISSGVSMLDGLNIIIDTSTNIIFKNAFITIKRQVEKGSSLGASMKQTEIFPPILVQMTLVGEQTGHLDETLERVSKYFETESELAIKALTTLIEPTILVFLGVGVGFLVFAIITPIYSLTSTIK